MESNKKVVRVVVDRYQDEELERIAKKMSDEKGRFISKSKLYRVAVKQFLRRYHDR